MAEQKLIGRGINQRHLVEITQVTTRTEIFHVDAASIQEAEMKAWGLSWSGRPDEVRYHHGHKKAYAIVPELQGL